MSEGRGLDLRLSRDIVARTRELEIENYALADRVVTMARWSAQSVIHDCGISREKVFTILPGANLTLPDDWFFPDCLPGRPGKDRPFVMGFVGKDWQRKGLPLLCDVRDALASRGWKSVVHAAGYAPRSLTRREGIEFVGFIDKYRNPSGFANFLTHCDMGCLFSEREALGISTLEFLRVGIPVSGFAIEGPADTIPPDAGFRFEPEASAADIADVFHAYLENPSQHEAFRAKARRYAPHLTWDRCASELGTVWSRQCVEGFRLVSP